TARRDMVVPLFARYVAAVVGLLIVITSARSVVGTLIVPRAVSSWLTRMIDDLVNLGFRIATMRVRDYRTRDRILSGQVATLLIGQILLWLMISVVGVWLIVVPALAHRLP